MIQQPVALARSPQRRLAALAESLTEQKEKEAQLPLRRMLQRKIQPTSPSTCFEHILPRRIAAGASPPHSATPLPLRPVASVTALPVRLSPRAACRSALQHGCYGVQLKALRWFAIRASLLFPDEKYDENAEKCKESPSHIP